MGWEFVAHRGFRHELSKLPASVIGRVKATLERLVSQLESEKALDSRRIFSSGPLTPVPDLKPLMGTGIPGSYRLRVGDYRVTLALLPDERLILLTAIARRTDTTYDKLPTLHQKRFHDR